MIDVSLIPCDSYAPATCRQALLDVLQPLGGLDWVQPGMKIAIKANLVSAMKPERAATTHPAMLAALTELLCERGAEVVIGDSPGGLYNAAFVGAVYRATGLEGSPVCAPHLNRDYSQKVAQFPQAKVAREFQYTAYLAECDAVINFCKLKTHGMMAMSAAAKNMFGTVPGTMKPEYHFKYPDPKDFARMLVDLNEYFKPRLSIVDAVVGMEGNGPTAGSAREIGALVAGFSPHKTDLVCAALIGLSRSDVPTLEAAYERGLIPASCEELTLAGSLEALRVADFKNVGAQNSHLFSQKLPGALGLLQSRTMSLLLSSRPQVRGADCIGCRKCAEICPAHAIVMKQKKPVIDRKKCIRCFCCQEFCPKGAMKVHRTVIARLLNR
ncbi:MAG: DUF362 domain-containing protein [Oscillospiraceae bacterium]|nr:DUF362 domain-containing protein [Oscillospiraceae bacterium]